MLLPPWPAAYLSPRFTNIDPAEITDPQARVGHLISRRPDNSTRVDAEATFPARQNYKYWLVLMKSSSDVEYRVYETPATVPDSASANQLVANFGPPVATVNRVSESASFDARVNEGVMTLPEKSFSGTTGLTDRDQHNNQGPSVPSTNASFRWDRTEQLLISTSKTDCRTVSCA